jgi:hypothetical protein
MEERPVDPAQATLGDVFRVVTGIRKEQAEMRAELSAFRTSVDEQLETIRRRLEGQTEAALNVALHVLGEQRTKLRELVDWANSRGAQIEKLP